MGVYDYQAKSIDGNAVGLDRFRGKWLLIVNVASKCGLTPQYEGLEALYRKYKDRGLEILGFPCDQFGHQEPGTESEIKEFCSLNYDVSFPLFSKIEVNGGQTHALYVHLKKAQPAPAIDPAAAASDRMVQFLQSKYPDYLSTDAIRWNFTKFLADKSGKVVKRFEPAVTPEAIDAELAKLLV